ncbi:MAG: A24 family peptidase [Thiohalocapsa sp.]|nr:A24 family peptidase [Thiohalocapsa sp.]MCF7990433.1 A24 family peptidase [Thiohalocapsa sp.]
MDAFVLLTETPWLLYASTALAGLIVGSFLNVVILRLPKIMEQEWRLECSELHESAPAAAASPADGPQDAAPEPLTLAHPASHCPHCGHRIRAWENIPVVSFLLLRGRCSNCKTPISWRYPLVEALTAVLSVIVIWQFGPTVQGLLALLLTWGLVALAAIDFDTQLLPDDITLPLLWIGLLASIPGVFVDSPTAIIGAAAGYLSLWAIFHGFRLLTGKEGLGRGDFKLLALFGAWLGWQSLPQIVLLSTIPGALFGIALIAAGRSQRETPIAFGPFLAISGWVSLVWGEAISSAYLRWAGII